MYHPFPHKSNVILVYILSRLHSINMPRKNAPCWWKPKIWTASVFPLLCCYFWSFPHLMTPPHMIFTITNASRNSWHTTYLSYTPLSTLLDNNKRDEHKMPTKWYIKNNNLYVYLIRITTVMRIYPIDYTLTQRHKRSYMPNDALHHHQIFVINKQQQQHQYHCTCHIHVANMPRHVVSSHTTRWVIKLSQYAFNSKIVVNTSLSLLTTLMWTLTELALQHPPTNVIVVMSNYLPHFSTRRWGE